MPLRLLLLLLSCLSTSGCFLFADDDDDDSFEPEPFVETLDYTDEDAGYLVTLPIAENRVTNPADVPAGSTYSISPALPAGLSIDSVTGSIEGVPNGVVGRTPYSVSASSGGSIVGRATLFITILPANPPANLAYASNPAVYEQNRTIAPNVPSFNGVIDTFTINPALPGGLTLDAATGEISGRPQQAQAAQQFTITGLNPFGSTTADLSVEIRLQASPHSLFVTDGTDPVLLTYVADNFPGNLYQRGYEELTSGALHVAAHPDGRFLYALELNGDIRKYRPQNNDARPLDGNVVASLDGASRLAVSRVSNRLLVLAAGILAMFDIDANGDLSGPQTAIAALGATDVVVHPSQQLAYVCNGFNGGLTVYQFSNGLGALPGTAPLAGFGEHLALDEVGNFLYVGETNARAVHTFRITAAAPTGDTHLEPIGTPQAVPGLLEDVAVTPDGRQVFASTGFNATVEAFVADQEIGGLTPNGSNQVGSYITELIVDPDSRLLYALDIVQRDIHVLGINSTNLTFRDRSRTRQSPQSMALVRGPGISNPTDHVFVVNETQATVGVFSLDRSTETLQAGTQLTTRLAPSGVEFHSGLDVLYVPQSGGGRIAQMQLDRAANTLSFLNPVEVDAGTSPSDVTLGASREFAYVIDATGALLTFTVDPNSGVLSDTGSSVAIAANAGPAVAEPTGQYLYVLDAANNQVAAFTLNRVSGAPQPLATLPTPNSPSDLIAMPQGRCLFVSSSTNNNLTTLEIALDGTLTTLGVTAITGAQPSSIDIMTQGFNLYAGNPGDSTISIHNVDFSSGELSSFGPGVSPVTVPDGLTDLFVDQADLYLFATFGGEISELILYKSQPTESILEVDSIPLNPGIHHLGANSVHD